MNIVMFFFFSISAFYSLQSTKCYCSVHQNNYYQKEDDGERQGTPHLVLFNTTALLQEFSVVISHFADANG